MCASVCWARVYNLAVISAEEHGGRPVKRAEETVLCRQVYRPLRMPTEGRSAYPMEEVAIVGEVAGGRAGKMVQGPYMRG